MSAPAGNRVIGISLKGVAMEEFLKRLLTLKVRKKRRFKVKKGLSVVVSGATGIGRNRINDIGMGGLSFYYTDDGHCADNNGRMKNLTVIPDGQPAIIHIPCQTVCDAETGELIFPNQCVKRRSVKFGRLSENQKKQMRKLIKEFAR